MRSNAARADVAGPSDPGSRPFRVNGVVDVQRAVKPFGRARRSLHVDVLALIAAEAIGETVQQRRAAGTATADDDGDAGWCRFERCQDSAFETCVGSHHRPVS